MATNINATVDPRLIRSANELKDCFITRKELALRWRVCDKTLLRLEREGLLKSVTFGSKKKVYSINQVLEAESVKRGSCGKI